MKGKKNWKLWRANKLNTIRVELSTLVRLSVAIAVGIKLAEFL